MNLTMRRGDTLTWRVAVTDENGPVSLVGTQLAFRAAKDFTSEALIERTTENGGITITDAAAGIAEITLQQLDTAPFPGHTTKLFYDVSMSAGMSMFTLISGTLTVEPDVMQTFPAEE